MLKCLGFRPSSVTQLWLSQSPRVYYQLHYSSSLLPLRFPSSSSCCPPTALRRFGFPRTHFGAHFVQIHVLRLVPMILTFCSFYFYIILFILFSTSWKYTCFVVSWCSCHITHTHTHTHTHNTHTHTTHTHPTNIIKQKKIVETHVLSLVPVCLEMLKRCCPSTNTTENFAM